MAREKTSQWGEVFTMTRPGLWEKKGGVTTIEKNVPDMPKGWWVSTPKEGFINVFNTLKDVLKLRWD
tara:strand:+ start:190 stop:390 length:201 start_codon:yes stop_codon:yes gene_type:complete